MRGVTQFVFCLLLPCLGLTVATTVAGEALTPAPKRANARFYELHASFLKRGAEGPVGVLFLGDSITEGWTKVPEIWNDAFGAYQPANFGIGGDRTQHVLWRIHDGEFDRVRPKVVVLMIGTNNSGDDSGEEIAAANREIISLIRQKSPETKIVLLGIFPRGPRKGAIGQMEDLDKRRAAIRQANTLLAQLDNGQSVRYLDLGSVFLDPDGTIPAAIMPDQLHLSPEGYRRWAAALRPTLETLLRPPSTP